MASPRDRTSSLRCTFAPGVPDAWSLGAESPEGLLQGELWGRGAQEPLQEGAGGSWSLCRVPLPGTPLEGQEGLRGAPRGIGTGWIRLRTFSAWGAWRSLRSRLSAPGGSSPAEREWNLLCHLRAAGVATVEPLAVLADDVSGRSVLITRDVDPGPSLAEAMLLGEERIPGLGEALTHFAGRLVAAGAVLPTLVPERIRVQGLGEGQAHDAPEGSCALEQVLAARGDRPVEFGERLTVREVPSLVLEGAEQGGVRARGARGRWDAWLAGLDR